MGHPNLSDALNALIQMGEDPGHTLNMFNVAPGEKITILFEGNNECYISFEVTHPAGPDPFKNKATGRLLSMKLSKELLGAMQKDGHIPENPEGEEIKIGGAATWNPYAPLGMTMYHGSHISVGRVLVWGFTAKQSDITIITPVKAIYILKHD